MSINSQLDWALIAQPSTEDEHATYTLYVSGEHVDTYYGRKFIEN